LLKGKSNTLNGRCNEPLLFPRRENPDCGYDQSPKNCDLKLRKVNMMWILDENAKACEKKHE
jgi:hypothetical protein